MASVAVTGEVNATKSEETTLDGAAGSWAIVPPGVTEQSYGELKVGGKAVIYEASCTFMFTETMSPYKATPLTLTLRAKASAIQGGSHNVLRDADSTEEHGNRLAVQLSRPAALATT